ncbi:MAG: DUF1822 family protein [Microcoleaceae cyanobacterium]
MMETLTFTVPLYSEAHQIASQFRQQQFDANRAKQVYLNTLSVYAVDFYLNCMGFRTNWESSNSFDPMIQRFMDVADLEVNQIGRFECRPVLPDESTVHIPPETWSDRRGYFAVQLNSALTEARILGFLRKAEAEAIPLIQVKSLDDFLKYSSQLEASVKLDQWLQNVFETGWETVNSLLAPPQMAWRSGTVNHGNSNSQALKSTKTMVERVKVLSLNNPQESVGLLVRITPRTALEMEIWVELYPIENQTYLPPDLKLSILDEEQATVMQAETRSTESLQLKFSGETGEGFGVQIIHGTSRITETFFL